jgi:LmbE family N-acetylglucosaminyl deacetylase
VWKSLLVLSPHADDAALSVGGLIQSLTPCRSVLVLTLFGRSNYSRNSDAGNWEAVTEMRKREDLAFTQRVGASLVYFDFPEAALRYRSFDQIFARNSQRLNCPSRMLNVLRKLLRQLQPVLVLAPLGLGSHRDHLVTMNLGRRICRDENIPIAYYEDLPYAEDYSERKIRQVVKRIDETLRPISVQIRFGLNAKLNNLSLYRTQISAEEMSSVAEYAKRWTDPTERIWSTNTSVLC